jgi:hypothetical protein
MFPRFGSVKFNLGIYLLIFGKLRLNFGNEKLKCGRLNPDEPPRPVKPDPDPVPPLEPLEPPPEDVPLDPGLLESGCI